MKKYVTQLSLNRRLAIIAFALGFIALFAGNPYQGAHTTLDAKELSLIIEKEADHIATEELADWIVQGRSDFRLVDLRSEKDFAEYRIPSAENIPMASLTDSPLLRNEKIVLYSEGVVHASQAWMLLKARNYKSVYVLRGGLDEWKEKILFPRIPGNPNPEQLASFEKMKELSKLFGGTPQTGAAGSEESTPKLTMPKLEMPAPGATGTAPKKKKKEGC